MDRTYEAHCQRSGKWWAIDLVDDSGEAVAFTQARQLLQVEFMARDALAILFKSRPEQFRLTVVPRLGGVLESQLRTRSAAKKRARDAAEEAARADADTARALLASGLTMRDAGAVMGVAHQRVAQLVSTRD